jgi:maleate isomerase
MTSNGSDMWRPDGWGHKARIGLLVPHIDVVPETELRAIAPEGVSIHAARIPFGQRVGAEPTPLPLDTIRAFAEPPHVDEAIDLLAGAPVTVIAYAFTSSSYLIGPKGDAALQRRLEGRSRGIPVLIPCVSAVMALHTLGVRRLFLVHPPWFTADLDRLGANYFRGRGFEVTEAVAARLRGDQLSIQPSEVYEWVCSNTPTGTEGVFVGGNGFRVIAVVESMEARLGLPVITANTVLLWHALRAARVAASVEGYGDIFSRDLPL